MSARPAQPVASSSAALSTDRGVTSLQAADHRDPSAQSTMDLTATPTEPSPGMTQADQDLARAARHRLLGDTMTQNCPSLEVSASNGKVMIHGTVDTALQRLSAIATVAQVPGVDEVDDDITVSQPDEPLPVTPAPDTTNHAATTKAPDPTNLVAR
ncbi:MAG TPA: BON domain-containing protein [Polyangiaceae bacterium]|nr:BON domain-containing protein [Polyangiaceae bacterium]